MKFSKGSTLNVKFFNYLFLHTIWAFLKGVNYSYATTQDFINNLILGICINLLIGFSLRGLIKNRKIRASFFFVFIFVLVMALRYRYRSLASVDMYVIFDNFDLAFNSNGASVIFSKFGQRFFHFGHCCFDFFNC